MRYWLTCLLLIGCGQSASSDGASGSGGDAARGGAGQGATAADGGKSGTQAGGGVGGVPSGGKGGTQASAGRAGGASGTSGKGGAAGQSASPASLRLTPNVIAGKQTSSTSNANIGSGAFSQRVGTASGTSLLSLKYYVQSIQLCEDLELMGSGYNNPRGCVTLYQNQESGAPDYNTYLVTQALADTTPGRYIDLMSAQGQSALRQPRTVQLPPRMPNTPNTQDADAGVEDVPDALAVFRYGLINFYRPIKVKAEFPIVGEPGMYFRTKAVTQVRALDPMGGFGREAVDIGNTLMGDTEETTYMLNNGGVLFTFQKPFVITQADVDAKTEMKIDLVFNPENFGQAYDGVACQSSEFLPICDPVNSVAIDMPFVRMSPVPRKQGERTRKETYLMDYETNSKLRIELYYNDADPQAGIQGVDVAVVYGTTAPGLFSNNIVASNFVSQNGSVQTSDASVSLLDYRHMESLSGLRRRQAGTATIHCVFGGGGLCPTLGATVTRAYTYEGDTMVSAD